MIDLIARRREMMGASVPPRQYVNIFQNTFPVNGVVSGRNSMYIYTTESQPVGTDIHLSFDIANVPASVTYIHINQSTMDLVATRVAVIEPPFSHVDVEFTTTRAITYVSLFFSENVTDVPVTNIVLEKII